MHFVSVVSMSAVQTWLARANGVLKSLSCSRPTVPSCLCFQFQMYNNNVSLYQHWFVTSLLSGIIIAIFEYIINYDGGKLYRRRYGPNRIRTSKSIKKICIFTHCADNRLETIIARGRRFKEVKKKLYVVISIIK